MPLWPIWMWCSQIAGRADEVQQSALAFTIVVVVVFVLLHMLFRVIWGPAMSSSTSSPSGLRRLSQGVVAGIAGWVLGVMLTISLVTSQAARVSFPTSGTEMTLYRTAFVETAKVTTRLINPWLPNGLPLFLQDWALPDA